MVSKNLWKQNHVLEYSNKETPVSGSNKKLHILKSSAYPQARGGVQWEEKDDPVCGVLLGFSWTSCMQYYFLQTFTGNHWKRET